MFLGSLMDIFDPEVPIEWFTEAMTTVRRCSDIDFLLVTKRPELALERIRAGRNYLTTGGCAETAIWLHDWLPHPETPGMPATAGRAPQNVWVITSTENQEQLEKRIPHLLAIPAVVHGLSCEPLLGPLELKFDKWLNPEIKGQPSPGVNWVIAGGESGPGARRCSVDWLRDLRRQCAAASVAYFCKQFGSNSVQDLSYAIPQSDSWEPAEIAAWEDHRFNSPLHLKDKKGGKMEEWPDDMRVRQWPEVAR